MSQTIDIAPKGQSSGLSSRDLNSVLRVLEDCGRASSLSEFRLLTLDGMERYLGYRNSGFFVGATLELAFDDMTGPVHGPVARLVPQFLDHDRHDSVFAQPDALGLLNQHQVVTLDQLPRPTRPNLQYYLDNLYIHNRILAEMVIPLHTSGGMAGFISAVDDESGAFSARDVAISDLLSRHLANLLRLHTGEVVRTSPISSALSGRQAEVVALLASGMTNLEIAKTLFITMDTVKKHITRALQITESRNRTELALAWRSQANQGALIEPVA